MLSKLKTLLPYKFEVGTVVPYYGNRDLKITSRSREFAAPIFSKFYTLEGMGELRFSEDLIWYYLNYNHPDRGIK